MPELTLDQWQVENLRLSAFAVDPIAADAAHFWQSLVGSLPVDVRTQPQQQSSGAESPFERGRLRVELRLNRIDWRLLPDHTAPHERLPVVGPFDQLGQTFRDLMRRWICEFVPLHRLAYGTGLFLPATSDAEACVKLAEILPALPIDPGNSRDLTYRINRRRPSQTGIADLQVNRLATWSVVTIQQAIIDLSQGEVRASHPIEPLSFGCRLELDINTAPDFKGILEPPLLPAVFDELLQFGEEISAQGDIA